MKSLDVTAARPPQLENSVVDMRLSPREIRRKVQLDNAKSYKEKKQKQSDTTRRPLLPEL